jgi:chromosome segregation ATPase
MVLRQKENLSGTCEDQANYIAELTQRLDILQAEKSRVEEDIQVLRDQRLLSDDTQQRFEQVSSQLVHAQQTIAQLEESLRQKEQSMQQASDASQRQTDDHKGRLGNWKTRFINP